MTATGDLLPRWIAANGLEFGYLDAGEGPLVLCLHGFPDTAWSFRPLLATLAANGFRAVAPFMRGYAPSSVPADGNYETTTLARDVIALIDHFGAKQAFVVGHDWGAMAAYVAATMRPDRITRIVTAAVPHPRRLLLRLSLRQMNRFRYIALFQLRVLAERRIVARDFAWLESLIREWSPHWKFTAEDLAPIKANLSDPARLAAALGYYRAMPRELARLDTWQLLGQSLPVPARVILGEDDGCIGAEMFRDMEHLFDRGLDLRAMQGVGHFMHREKPEAFAGEVLGFLKASS